MTKATAEFEEKLFTMVVDNLVPMIEVALKEQIPENKHFEHSSNRKKK